MLVRSCRRNGGGGGGGEAKCASLLTEHKTVGFISFLCLPPPHYYIRPQTFAVDIQSNIQAK